MHICFLDIDGTLVLTGGAGHTAFARTLALDFGIEPNDHTVQFAGRSDRAIAMDLFRGHGIATTTENWLRFRAAYLGRLEEALTMCSGYVLPGVESLLAELTARGDVALGLLTGNIREGARRKLVYYGLWNHFAFGGFGDEYLERCDIAAAALASARHHLAGRESNSNGSQVGDALGQVIVIGDTQHDIDCGRSIGARCVAVPTGHTSAETLHSHAPDVLVETLEDTGPILALLDGHLS
jgi:phosphoglycolate phosphatase-like HAD superfamily hydrolase